MSRSTSAPPPVRASNFLWIGAILTAVIELAARLGTSPEGFVGATAQGLPEIGVRGLAYTLLLWLSFSMLAGHNWARWALLVIFGGFGTFSLIFEPLQWLAEGGALFDFLASANAATWIMTVARVLHVLCVWVGAALMFQPAANTYFAMRAAL